MDTCRRCGQALGVGRYCTNCGHPVDAPVAAERPPALPPDPAAPSRPLFVDEVVAQPPSPPTRAPLPPPVPSPPPARSHGAAHHRRRSGRWLPWLVGFVALAVVAGLGTWLLLSGGDDTKSAEAPDAPAPTRPRSDPAEAEPSTDRQRDRPKPADPPQRPRDLADAAAVSAPRAARPSRDTDGSAVTYVAANLVDGDLTTCWRMAGNGSGESIMLRFGAPVRLRAVGLVNGYAKTGSDSRGTLDWYAGNRRVRRVEWTFDDGTVVTQDLGQSRALQHRRLPRRVETETITLRLLDVSRPGGGRASRDYTAISEVSLRGTTT